MDDTPKKCPYRKGIKTLTNESIKTKQDPTGESTTISSVCTHYSEKCVFEDCYAEKCATYNTDTGRCAYTT